MEKIVLIIFIVFCVICLISLNIYFGRLTKIFNKVAINDELEYMMTMLQRYTSVSLGDGSEIAKLKLRYNIQVNFHHYIVGADLMYLFDQSKKLFAICDTEKNSTYLFGINRAQDVFKEHEKQFQKTKIKPGEILLCSHLVIFKDINDAQ